MRPSQHELLRETPPSTSAGAASQVPSFDASTRKADSSWLASCLWRSESLEICYYEWSADAAALASDGQYWRSVFGGARLALGTIRCTPNVFLLFRLTLTGATAAILYLQLDNHPPSMPYWLLYFESWVMIVQLAYFVLASVLTFIATCTNGSISRTTPFLVRCTEICYSILPPATIILALYTFCIEYLREQHCVPAIIQHYSSKEWKAAVYNASLLVIVLLDALFNRQPYYATFNALIGAAFCYTYLAFNGIYEAAGGTNEFGQSYIYRCLDWSMPLDGSRTANGKLLTLNFFVFVPLLNLLLWFLVWGRRRTLAHSKALSATASASAALLSPQPKPVGRRPYFELSADYRDLLLDGRSWRAQFGGASRPNRDKIGAYVCCNACWYAVTRVAFAMVACALYALRVYEFQSHYGDRWWCVFLYLQNWMLLLSLLYFITVAGLTTYATRRPGAEARTTPLLVWLAWALNGALVPLTLCTMILYPLIQGSDEFASAWNGFDWTAVYLTVAMVLVDLAVNRQPYYATFHGLLGLLVCWMYFLLLLVYPSVGGKNESNQPYIYSMFPKVQDWTLQSGLAPGKFFTAQVLLLLPIYSALYWCMLWAVRRARVAAKKPPSL